MTSETRMGVSRGESRRLRSNPEMVFESLDQRTQYRAAVTRSGEHPHPTSIVAQTFVYDGRWRPTTDTFRFADSDAGRRNIASAASSNGLVRKQG